MQIIIPYIFLTALTLCRMEFKKTVKDTLSKIKMILDLNIKQHKDN